MGGKRLFLIDGSELAYRAYFAFIRNPLINSKGENTSAVFGFTNTLLKLLREEEPEYIGIVFDTKKPTFRHQMFEGYKATRQKMPPEMSSQLPRIRELVEALSLPILEIEGYEADDLIGTLAKKGSSEGYEVVIFSGDKDMLQLVTEGIRVMRPGREGRETVVVDREGVRVITGVRPERVPDFLGLMGDSSDNVPGVPGVGPKTAARLVRDFGAMEGIFKDLERISPERLKENLRQHREDALLSKRLVTIATDIPLEIEIENLARDRPNVDELVRLFKDLEFTKFLSQIVPQEPAAQVKYTLVNSSGPLEELGERLRSAGIFSLDLETTHQEPMKARIVGFSFAPAKGEAYYLPVGHLLGNNLGLEEVRAELGPILQDEGIKKVGQNIKYDKLVLDNNGFQLKGICFDTMVASYLLDPSSRQHNLDLLSLKHLNHKMIPLSDLLGKGRDKISFDRVPISQAIPYSCEDADITLQLKEIFEPKLKSLKLWPLFEQVEMPLLSVLYQMERNGVTIDRELLREMSAQMEAELSSLAEDIYRLAGCRFNINSPQQLSQVLFERLGLRRLRRTKTGYSTDVGVLEELSKDYDIAKKLLEYRQLSKLKCTYVDALPQLINSHTGRIHTSFNQTVTATGRLSSSDPNLQNIPIRTDLGKRIREAFIPGDPNSLILSADYSQIELRIMAHLSEDQRLIDAFQQGEDIHRKTASLIFGLPLFQVTPQLRSQAKVVNFGIIYGMGPHGLSSRLDMPLSEAEEFIANYFLTYPQVKEYIETTIEKAKVEGYVTTLLNRRRYLPELREEKSRDRSFAQRTAINTPVQGSAADMIKLAMINIQRELWKRNLGPKMIIQVHDELVFEVPKGELEEIATLVKNKMETALTLKVPIKVDIGWGENWSQAHP